jgi:hypothetical protein
MAGEASSVEGRGGGGAGIFVPTYGHVEGRVFC